MALLSLALGLVANPVAAQIFRCTASGAAATEYINNVKEAQNRGCKAMEGGNVTVVMGNPVPKAVRVAAPAPAASGQRLDDGAGQKSRDNDARAILEAELKKAEAKLAEQQKDYNHGAPEKQGIEARNYQRYLDRVAEMKDAITRSQSDVAGLKREIGRLPAGN